MTATHPEWFDTTTPTQESAVLPFMLERNARQAPDKVCCRFADGSEWSYQELLQKTRETAALFEDMGVERGDLVLSWLPNGPAALRTWFGLNYIGAVFVPLNLDYRGRLLEHVIRETQSSLIVAHHQLVERLADIDRSELKTVLSIGGDAEAVGAGTEVITSTLESQRAVQSPADMQLWDPQMVIFTSGTTGRQKACCARIFSRSRSARALMGT